MSNQFDNGFQGSQPFITDNEYKSLSLDQLRYILNEKKKEIKKNYKQLSEKEKIIRDIRKLDKLNEKVKKGVDIKKDYKKKKDTTKKKKIKTFDEYFAECIKNKEIPKDTPLYLREALERAMREYDQGLVKEKSSLSGFANKYIIEGVFGLKPEEFFENINETLVDFFTYHRNIKFKLVLVCLMEKQEIEKTQGIIDIKEDKAYFNSPTFNNLESDDVQRLIDISKETILGQMEAYSEKGSNWVFKEVVKFEIHTVEYNPNKGSSYIDLPSWIKNKKAIVNIKNKDDKCFLWCILRYLHPKESQEERIKDLEKYEFSLNTKGITFPMKVNNITQFEKLNPELPGINVFSNDDKMIIYPLREAKRDCKNTIDLFLYEEDGQYRGAAHNKCNLMCKKPKVLPVIFHNLQGYDAHLFIKQLARLEGDLSCIPATEEKYISFSKSIKVGEYYSHKLDKMMDINFEIRFLDSFKFLQTSLANLVSNLSPDDFHNTKQVFKSNTELLTRKGVYPYDYVSSLDKLSETCLPPKKEFYSQLYDEDISDDDYQHAIKVWNTFECKTIRDYHNLYLKSDVLLLADVFENFRKTCLKHYKLDPVHYYTSPGLAWDACLKETGQQLQLLHDYDMLMMFEQGIRGGITHISKRYAEANNKYMKDYNPGKESTFIQYLDANNLYGWAMSQQLPTHGFKWMKDITLEKNYVVHYRNLRQCLELGMRITAVHRGISFYQSPWMEPYIRKNTELRMCAANNFEKDFFKLMNNSVFGKKIENIRKRQNIHLIDNRKKAVKLTSKPNFDRCTIFDKNLIAVHMLKTEVYFNKPVYVGQAILDLSKTLMFNFHYTYIKKKYKNKAELLFTDTDSLMYEIKTKDFYLDICPDVRDKFDTSDYPLIHPSGIITGVNKKVIGMFKDEVGGKQITHFVGLRPKLYSFKIEEDREVKKCEREMRKMKIIRSEKHDIYSKEEVDYSKEPEKEIKKIIFDNDMESKELKEYKKTMCFHNLTKYIQLDTDEYIPMKIYVEVEDPVIGKKLKELVHTLEKTHTPEQFYLHKKEVDEDAYFAEGYNLTMNEEQKQWRDFYDGKDVEGLEELLREKKLYP
ncbi:unnamed protein product [Porites evermanni]|uniref:DNA-directed DNA polymerase n=1 Tax=Porites evermanni TaxID=104178 RepID=A0ABN8LHQ6_9CNID|nr:unnamed protein product [Porites evermanni]